MDIQIVRLFLKYQTKGGAFCTCRDLIITRKYLEKLLCYFYLGLFLFQVSEKSEQYQQYMYSMRSK